MTKSSKTKTKLFLLAILGLCMAGNAMAEDHYLVGGATECGWVNENMEYNRSSVAMVNVSENVWVWAGEMNVGEGDAGAFKIPNSANGWDGYWAPSSGYVLTSGVEADLSTNSSGDNKYHVAEAGVYRVTINTSTNKIKAEKLTEPSKDGDYYLISSVDNYFWFAGKVTSANSENMKARLTADLNFAEKGFFPLACDKYKFKGEFDGGGHAMTNMTIIGVNKNIGLARYATGGAYIHDLVFGENSSFTGYEKIGGIVGFARDHGEVRLTNVINKANVHATGTQDQNADSNAAGLVACAVDNTTVNALNCANMGNVSSARDGQCAAFIGWSQSRTEGNETINTTFTNCWNSGAISNIEGSAQLYRNSGVVTAMNCFDLTETGNQGTRLASTTLASGELCYKLNGNVNAGTNWYQNLSGNAIDTYPVPFSSHAQVYGNGDLRCDGVTPKEGSSLTFANSEGTGQVDEHDYENGFCTFCDNLQEGFMTATNGVYEIGNEHQLRWFAEYVNLGNNTINGKLTDDINYSSKQSMIGNADNGSHAYKGTFDGQGHKVTLALSRTENHGALFMYLYSGAVVRNLITDGTITMTGGKSHGSGIFSGSRGETLVENCVSYVTITSDKEGDATIGGIGAFMFDNGAIKNCAFLGTINAGNGNGSAGILGYANGGSRVHVENCYVNASLTVRFTNNSNKIIGRGDPTIVNCYYVGSMGNMQNFMASDNTIAQATEASTEQMGSGELTFLLNQKQSTDVVWHQVIGTDAKPLPYAKTGGVVYANGNLYCDGTPKPESTYSNVQETATTDEHTFGDWGFCTYCDAFQTDFASQDNDGYYLLDNAKKINWFAVLVDGRETLPVITAEPTAKAKLTADIDFQEDLGNDYQSYNFPGIGTSSNKYHGIFDGQGHVISHLNMNRSNEDAVGFFRYVTSGGTIIKRFTLDNTCSFSGAAGVGAFAGRAEGRNGNRDLRFEELGNEANVTASGANGGGILGVDMFSDAVITMNNCYNAGTITSGNEGGGISGWLGDNAVLTNVYNMGTVINGDKFARGGNQNKTNCYDSDANYADGTVFAALFAYNESGVDGSVWRWETVGTTHPVLHGNKIAMNENSTNRMVENGAYDVTMFRTVKTGGWNTVCLPFNMDANAISSYFGDDTTVAMLDESNTANDDVLHFKSVTAIEAGQAYLVYPGVTTDFDNKTIEGVTITATTPSTGITQAGFTFKGVYAPTPLDANTDRIVAGGNTIVKTSGGNLKGFRAYFDAPASARATRFVIDDEATGIITPEGEFIEDGPVYNLGGQRVNKPQRGLYIQNGKKVIR